MYRYRVDIDEFLGGSRRNVSTASFLDLCRYGHCQDGDLSLIDGSLVAADVKTAKQARAYNRLRWFISLELDKVEDLRDSWVCDKWSILKGGNVLSYRLALGTREARDNYCPPDHVFLTTEGVPPDNHIVTEYDYLKEITAILEAGVPHVWVLEECACNVTHYTSGGHITKTCISLESIGVKDCEVMWLWSADDTPASALSILQKYVDWNNLDRNYKNAVLFAVTCYKYGDLYKDIGRVAWEYLSRGLDDSSILSPFITSLSMLSDILGSNNSVVIRDRMDVLDMFRDCICLPSCMDMSLRQVISKGDTPSIKRLLEERGLLLFGVSPNDNVISVTK